MKELRSPYFAAGVAVAFLFVPLVIFLPRPYLFDVVNALTVSVGLGVLIAYGPGVWRSFSERSWSGGHYLVLGITVTWAATLLRHLWNWGWRFFGKPESMIDSPLVAFMVWMAMMGGALHLAAKGAIEGGVPRENWLRLGIAIAVGVGLAAMVIVFFEPTVPAAAAIPR